MSRNREDWWLGSGKSSKPSCTRVEKGGLGLRVFGGTRHVSGHAWLKSSLGRERGTCPAPQASVAELRIWDRL